MSHSIGLWISNSLPRDSSRFRTCHTYIFSVVLCQLSYRVNLQDALNLPNTCTSCLLCFHNAFFLCTVTFPKKEALLYLVRLPRILTSELMINSHLWFLFTREPSIYLNFQRDSLWIETWPLMSVGNLKDTKRYPFFATLNKDFILPSFLIRWPWLSIL